MEGLLADGNNRECLELLHLSEDSLRIESIPEKIEVPRSAVTIMEGERSSARKVESLQGSLARQLAQRLRDGRGDCFRMPDLTVNS